MSMQPPGNDPNPQRSWLAQLLMNIFNGGQSMANPFYNQQKMESGLYNRFPQGPAGAPPLDMSVAGPWGAGHGEGPREPEGDSDADDVRLPSAAKAPRPTPRPDAFASPDLAPSPNPYAPNSPVGPRRR